MATIRWAALICLVMSGAACSGKGDGTLEVLVTASPPLDGVATIHVDAVAGGRKTSFEIHPSSDPVGVSIPPDRSFALVVPLDASSHVNLKLAALDSSGNALAGALGTGDVRAGHLSTANVSLTNDADGDHDVLSSDCDDYDPSRHHATDIDPFPDPVNCCGYSLGKKGTSDENTDFLHDQNDPGCFSGQCQHDAALCPMQRCNDGIDEACQGSDTGCVIDEDCDGFAAPPQGDDCDDHDPNAHPGALEHCGGSKDLNCDSAPPLPCVPCDLDGDGFQRNDSANGCPDANNQHPGKVDCNDWDSGVFPGQTANCGNIEAGNTAAGMVACAVKSNCRRVLQSTGQTSMGTPRIASPGGSGWMVGDADCNGTPFEGCPSPTCDVDGDGFPNSSAGCNPNGLPLDCNDADPTVFPNAPDRCGNGIAENCLADSLCGGNDADGDGYVKGVDCDDANPAIHPWAIEVCDGVDNDCDGLVDEANPDPSGNPLVTASNVTECTDSNTGECGKQKGTCVCSSAAPATDPLLAQLNQPKTACVGSGAKAKPVGCFGAGQPHPQSCDSTNPKDDDCDGRVDAPDGVRLAIKGSACGISVGQCKAGIVTACDQTQTNCFVAFGRTPSNTSWYVCSTQAPAPVAVCPQAELCNGLDDDCDGQLAGDATPPVPGLSTMDERDHDSDHYLACSGCGATVGVGVLGCSDCNDTVSTIHPGAAEVCNGLDDACAGASFVDGKDDCGKGSNSTKPTCCGGNGCRDTTSDPTFCGSCTSNTCSVTTADRCYMSNCSCGTTGAPCGSGLTCTNGVCTTGNGSTCSMDNQCQSGHCVDGHCCTLASCGTCKACTGAGGTCVNQPAGAPGNGCPDGSGNQVCDGGGACKKNVGQACGSNAECYNGRCVDGYCCNSTCGGQCQACNVSGNLGTCSAVTGAPVPPRAACNAGSAMCAGSCNGVTQTSCTYPGSTTPCPQVCTAGSGNTPAKIAPASCNGNGSCATGVAVNCMGTIKCDALGSSCLAHCASDADCVSADYCSSAGGGTCTPRHGNGASCAPEDCLMSPCNYCSAGSTCAASGQCCPTACVPAACSGGSQTTATCASGSCVPTTSSCNGYACDSATNLCKTACTGDADCLSTFYCDNTGHCAAETKTKNQACNNSACYQGLPCRQCQIDKVCSAGTCP